MVNLDLRHLQMLEVLAEARTLASAADALSITPSALTHRLREAERRIGAPVLVRGRRGVKLTPTGLRLVEVARRCLGELELAERAIERGGAAGVELVRMGASTLSGYEWLPGLLRQVESAGLAMEIEVVLDVSLAPVQALLDRKIDLAIMPTRVSVASTRSLPLFRDEMVAVVPAGHSKAGRAFLDAEDFSEESYVTDGTTRETGREFERLFEPSGVRPRKVLRAGHTEAVIALVRAGFGLTILTRRTAEPYLRPAGLVVIPLTAKGLFLEWHATLRREAFHGSPARTVADLLVGVDRRQARQIPASLRRRAAGRSAPS
jgi:LysR family transcriptional regulator for metE and metH